MVDEVQTLLNNEGINFIPSGKDYLIRCLNPDHEDRHPSLRIDKLMGIGQCLSCGYKINIFKHFGIFTDYKSARIIKLKEKIARCVASSVGLQLPSKSLPFISDYRGISGKTYKDFNAFTHPNFGTRVVFPIRSSDRRIVAFNGRATDPADTPRYKIFPEGVELPLFPGTLNPLNGSLILVEGIFDVLNLYDKGLTNAVAILGVNALHNKKGLNRNKVNLLKLCGATKLYLMFDGDDAGRKAAKELQPLLEEDGFFVDTIELEDDTDPGNLTTEYINRVKKYIL